MKGPYCRILSRKVVFSRGPIHLTDSRIRLRDGRTASRQILEHPGAVVILPRDDQNRFLLIRQYRFAAKQWLWEWPAGGIEKGETLRQTAARELMEEAGFRPGRLRKIAAFYPTPGISSEVMHLFLAENLKPETAPQDHDEDIRVKALGLREIGRLVRKRQILDAKTLLGYYLLKEMFG